MGKKKTSPSAGEVAARLIPPRTDCQTIKTIDLIAHKWTLHVLFTLHHAGSPVRFRQLQQTIGTITQKELTKRLRELERSGLVHRQIYAEVPPRVEYRLTELGDTLIPAMEAFSRWAEEHGMAVEEHRRRADAAPSGSEDVQG